METWPLPLFMSNIILDACFQRLLGRVDIIHYLLMVLFLFKHICKIFCLFKIVLITFSDRFIILCNEATALKGFCLPHTRIRAHEGET